MGLPDGEIYPDRISSCSIADVSVDPSATHVYINPLDGNVEINAPLEDVGSSFDDTFTVVFSDDTETEIKVTGEIVAICDTQIEDRTVVFSFEPTLGAPSSWIIGKAATSSDYEQIPAFCDIGIEVAGLDNDLATVRKSESFPGYLVLEIDQTDDVSLLDVPQ